MKMSSKNLVIGLLLLSLVVFLGIRLSKQVGLFTGPNLAQVSSVLSQGDGLRGEYYNGKNFETLFTSRTDTTINFSWGERRPITDENMQRDNFSVRWTGYVEPKFSEEYTFWTQSDDGIKLWVDGELIVNHWVNNSFLEKSGKKQLIAGKKYSIKIEYYENAYDAAVKLSWSSPSQTKQVIPQSQLYTTLPVVAEPAPVVTPAPVVSFSSSSSSITSGESATLSWSVTNASSCTASGGWTGNKERTGTQTVSPTSNTTYTLSCTGTGGTATQSKTVNVNSPTVTEPTPVIPAPTVSLSASPSSIATGGSSTLVWSSTNATSCTASGGWTGSKSTSGNQSVTPTTNTTYTLTCAGTGGTISQSTTVSVTVSVPPSTGLLLHSTLDSLASVTSPLVGTGIGAGVKTSPTNDFTGGKIGNGIYLDSITEYVRFAQTDGVKKNVELDRGTADFWFKPFYNHNDDLKYRIFSNGQWGSPGSFGVGKHNASNNNAFYIHKFSLTGALDAINTISVSDYSWKANEWVNVRITWDWKVASGVQNIRVYFNGVEAKVSGDNGKPPTTGTWGTASESPTNHIYVGNVGPNSTSSSGMYNNAMFDEIKIWDTVIPPTTVTPQPPTTTPPSTKFIIGDNIQTTSALNIRSTANGTLLGTQTLGATGSVIGGPVYAGGYHWWNVDFVSGVDGWSAENFLAKATVVTPGPTTPIQTPELPRVYVDTTMPTQTGKVWAITGGDSAGFQQALNQAALGDTIELQAGSTYTGSFTFPKKTTGSGWIVVRSSNHTNLPASGTRVSPSHAINMPKLVTSGSNAPTIVFAKGSHHYRLIGLEVTLPTTITWTQNSIVSISPSSGNTADLPNNITLDRMYVHAQPTNNVQRCIHADGSHVAVIDSYISECHGKGFDSQAVAAWNTNGPIKLVNNRLEGAGENIMFGGADPAINGAIPSDIEIRNNYVYTPASWGANMATKPWTKKNLFESKASRRVLIEGNVFDGSWMDGQVGNSFVIKTSNQSGACTWCQTTDLTIRHNIIRNVAGTGGVSGTSGVNNGYITGGLTSRVLHEHNIFENINVSPYLGAARLIEIFNNAQDVIYRNNTWNTTGYIQHFITGVPGTNATNFEYRDNIAPFGQYGITPGYSEATFAATIKGTYNYSNNVVYGTPGSSYYSTSKYPNTKLVSNYSTALGAGIGANQSAVLNATRGAVTGIWSGGSTTNPTPTVTLSASPTSISPGQSSTLTWSSTNATSCTASDGWTGSKTTSGTQAVSPTSNTTYALTCTGAGGNATQNINIIVTTVIAPSTKFIIGDNIQTTSALNIRSTANGTLLGTQTLGATGSVIGGPVYAGGYHWWNVDFVSGVDGWSAENFLVKVTTPSAGIIPPELPRVYVDTTMPTQTGKTINVNAGNNLQTAINNALPGDTLILQAGATFTGNFVLPSKSNPNNKWIVIKTSAESSLPPEGQRVNPTYAQFMPKIVTNNVAAVLDAAQGANYYRFIGIEFTDDGHSSPYGPALPGGGTGNFNYGLINLGQIGRDTQLSHLPHHIIFDRSYIHGQPITHAKYGISFDGMHMAAIDSYISDIHAAGQDSQAIRGINGAGPFKIVNNHLEGSGENVMFGGADPSIPNLVPSDVEIRNNYIYKPLTWKETHPSYAGINWLNKNLFETKNIQRMLFEGNILENSWTDGQTGFGFVMKSSNQDGKCPWCVSQDLTIRNNILKNTDNGASIHGLDMYSGGGGIGQRRVIFEQNLFENVGLRSIQMTQGSATQNDIQIRHNTIWSKYPSSYPSAINFDGGGTVVNNFLLENNIFVPGTSVNAIAVMGNGVGSGVTSLNRFITNWFVRGNAFITKPDSTAVSNNTYTTRANGGFVDATGNNFALTSTSPLKGTAVGGGDPGANIPAVLNATRGAVTGIWK